jgi:1-acyl-sn-glycerol-3-phosphate acyltransferase
VKRVARDALPIKFLPPLVLLARLLVGAYPRWIGTVPTAAQRIYFANHSSHMDTLVLWAALPGSLRANTRPVAARDYWGKGGIRQRIAEEELNVVMIDRVREDPDADPLDPLRDALEHGFSLIIFPEGTRTPQPLPGPFKSGLYFLAQAFPQVELIPVSWTTCTARCPRARCCRCRSSPRCASARRWHAWTANRRMPS